jgi:hypothetical protein
MNSRLLTLSNFLFNAVSNLIFCSLCIVFALGYHIFVLITTFVMAQPSTNNTQQPPTTGYVLFTTPLKLGSIDLDSPECPICREPYIDFQQSLPSSNESEGEWAVRVDISAAQVGGKRCCGHIFGRRCLERHVKGNEAWRNTCPICRAPWFVTETNGRPASTSSSSGRPVYPRSRASTRDRASQVARSVLRRCESRRGGDVRRTIDRSWNRRRSQPRVPFIEQVLGRFGIEADGEEIKASVEQVEETLDRMYRDLENESG